MRLWMCYDVQACEKMGSVTDHYCGDMETDDTKVLVPVFYNL